MRKELELMETIENYLKGNLSEADKITFEKRINTDPELQKEVELQKQLLKGIERTGLKKSAQQGFKKYKFNRNFKNWGLTGLTIAIVAASSLIVYTKISKQHSKQENTVNELPELNEQGEKLWSDADKYLPLQNFELNNEKDTVIETNDGIVFAIPANCFLDASGKPVKGPIQLEVKEALKAAEIMKAGLNTKSGDKLLETGGMFYLNARQDNASLKIDPKNTISAEIPTNEVKPGMQLFEGKRLADGTIDWVNPKPIQKDLIPVDILSLNFYPPNYLDSLKSWGYNTKDKKFTDSLYYSFASLFEGKSLTPEQGYSLRMKKGASKPDTVAKKSSMYFKLRNKKTSELVTLTNSQLNALPNWADQYEYVSSYSTEGVSGEKIFKQNCAVCHSIGKEKITGPGLEGIMERVPSEIWLKKFIQNYVKLYKSGDPYATKIVKEQGMGMTVFANMSDEELNAVINYIKNPNVEYVEGKTNGINPAKIKTIWNKEFQNTLVSTREFEERLPSIFNTCNETVLNEYINHLDKNLSSIDSEVYAFTGKKEFFDFASRGDGKVKNGNKNVQLLKKYYEEKSKIFTEAIAKTKHEFWEKQSEADTQAEEKKAEHSQKDVERLNENFVKELNLNLDNAYQQLGIKRPVVGSSTTQPTPIPPATYGVSVSSTGWCNIDRCVTESTMARKTIDFTDKETGKKAVIKYQPLNVSITDYKKYDRILVYLLPDELNSFMRVEKKNETYEEKLNELMIYKMVCVAYKGEESFYYSQDNVKPGSLTVSLTKTTNTEIQNNVNKLSNHDQVKAMNDDLNFMTFERQEEKRQAQLVKIKELTNKIQPVIFPCIVPAPTDSTAVVYTGKKSKK